MGATVARFARSSSDIDRQQAEPLGIENLPDEIVAQILGEALWHKCADPGCTTAVTDLTDGKAIRLVCRRFERLVADVFFAELHCYDDDEALKRKAGFLLPRPERRQHLRSLRLIMVDRLSNQQSRQAYLAPFKQFGELLSAGGCQKLATFVLVLEEVQLSFGPFGTIIQSILSGLAASGASSLRRLRLKIQRRMDDDEMLLRDNNHFHLLVAQSALVAVLNASPSITSLELEGLRLLAPSVSSMSVPPAQLRLKRLSVKFCMLPRPVIAYLASCLDEVVELSVQMVYGDGWHDTAEGGIVGSNMMPSLRTMTLNEKPDTRIDLDQFLQRHQSLRGFRDEHPYRHFVFVHHKDITTLDLAALGLHYRLEEVVKHLQAGNAPDLEFIRASKNKWSDDYDPEHVHELQSFCFENDIELLWTDADEYDSTDDEDEEQEDESEDDDDHDEQSAAPSDQGLGSEDEPTSD